MVFNTDNNDDNMIDVLSDTDTNKTYKNHCVYPTKVGGYVINAITGIEYPFRQGSYRSLQLFKVIICSGVLNENGCINRNNINKESVLTYYDSPNQYKQYTDINVPDSIIIKWKSRINFIFPNNEFSEKNYKEYVRNKKLIN